MEKSQGRGNASWRAPGLLLPFVSALLLICISQEPVAAVQHQVGGTPGWSLPARANVNYTTWASTQTFTVGDTLYFNYSKTYHNVLEVTEANYNNCSASNPIKTWDDGATTVSLDKVGTFYFLCGVPGHCAQGQKVAVSVLAASSSSSSSLGPNTLLHLSAFLGVSLIFNLQRLP